MEINGTKYNLDDTESGQVVLKGEDGGVIEVSCHVFIDEKYSDDRFICIPVYTGLKGQRQSLEIRLRPKGETLGYIFPVSSLVDDEGFDDQDKFRKIYAHAAVRHSLRHHYVPSLMRSNLQINPSFPVTFSDLFDDNYAICVIGRHLLSKYKIEEALVPLMLMVEGVFLPRNIKVFKEQPHNSMGFKDVISVGDLKYLKTRDFVESLLTIMQEADATDYLIGAFITYFQVIEILCDDVFSLIMSTIPRDLDPWTLREKVTNAANFKVRAQILFNQCGHGISAASRDGLKDACYNLLESLGKEVKRDEHVSNLVDIRNIIVHSQKTIIKGDLSFIKNLNYSFRSYLVEMMKTYIILDGRSYWGSFEAGAVAVDGELNSEDMQSLADVIKSVPLKILNFISMRR
ncbi:hypothetical protein [Rhizobium sp. Leaf386]|uniref:hypothetical protein n=1 Tax=Rhizobium sp. Leaf386 TaxID=1736359 RepID=UPI000AEDC637|nr:hypothetical protein [Rhizobium sp. Leaf386]